jgi:hypothetical protein
VRPLCGVWFLMIAQPYSVSVVVTPEFKLNLSETLKSGPVWIVDTLHNRMLVDEIWKAEPNHNHLDGVTLFKSLNARSAEERLIWNMDTIDLHHGEYSADLPYTALEIFGAAPTPDVKAALAEYGFDRFDATEFGFSATRPLHSAFTEHGT